MSSPITSLEAFVGEARVRFKDRFWQWVISLAVFLGFICFDLLAPSVQLVLPAPIFDPQSFDCPPCQHDPAYNPGSLLGDLCTLASELPPSSTDDSFSLPSSLHSASSFTPPPSAAPSLTSPHHDPENLKAVVQLTDASVATLKRVFFGGYSWVIMCSTFNSKQLEYESIIVQAASFVDAAIPNANLTVASLDCSRVLPSGESVYSRFSLDPTHAPVVFTVAYGGKPSQVPLSYLADSLKLAFWIRQETRPVLSHLQSTAHLKSLCMVKQTCIVLSSPVTSGSDAHTKVMLALHQKAKFRRDSFIYVNSSQHEVRITGAPALTATPNAQRSPRILYFWFNSKERDSKSGDSRTKSGVVAAAYNGPMTLQALENFLHAANAHSPAVPLTMVESAKLVEKEDVVPTPATPSESSPSPPSPPSPQSRPTPSRSS